MSVHVRVVTGRLGLDLAGGEALLANWSRRGRAWEFLPRSVSLVRRTPGPRS